MENAASRWEAAMRRGDFAAALAANDAVTAGRGGVPDDPRLPYHLRWVWDGRPFAARHVLVRCYHGLGDTLQFVRYLPALRRQAERVTLEVQPELEPLFARCPGADQVVAFDTAAPLKPLACDIEVMELAHALRLAPDHAPPPYLAVAPEAVAQARRRIGEQFAVGICWQAGGWDPARSVPIEAVLPALTGARLVRLQQATGCAPPLPQPPPAGGGGDPAFGSPSRCGRGVGGGGALSEGTKSPLWANPEDSLSHILTTAALVAAVDLVVTVDTMVAHLAGALGRPTALLLKARADWRWQDARADSPWYPSMRLYRQESPGDWAPPLARLAADVARLRAPGAALARASPSRQAGPCPKG